MSKIKFRFSYFILFGIIGFVIQLIAYFSFTDVSITASNLIAMKDTSYFQRYTANHIVFLVGTIFVIVMLLGYLFGKKQKKSRIFDTTIGGLIAVETILFVVTLTYLIYGGINRINMFSDKHKEIAKVISSLAYTKNLALMFSFALFSMFSFNILDVKKNSKFAKIGVYTMGTINSLAFLALFICLVTTSVNEAGNMLTNLYELKAMPPYDYIYPSLNGFTHGQFIRISYIFTDVAARGASNIFNISASLAIASLALYVTSLISNIFFLLIQLVESFDLSRDSNYKEI